jgi:hypothetical protein
MITDSIAFKGTGLCPGLVYPATKLHGAGRRRVAGVCGIPLPRRHPAGFMRPLSKLGQQPVELRTAPSGCSAEFLRIDLGRCWPVEGEPGGRARTNQRRSGTREHAIRTQF